MLAERRGESPKTTAKYKGILASVQKIVENLGATLSPFALRKNYPGKKWM
jgi:hypothetical protein